MSKHNLKQKIKTIWKLFKKGEKAGKEEPEHAPKPVVLIILDGFGISPIPEWNAVWQAKMPNFENYQREYPKTLLHSSSNEVGLPYGEFGNSEVGHLNIGSGRIVYQPLLRVNNELEAGHLNSSEIMDDMHKHLKKTKGALHLIGLFSAGGVHSHLEHLFEILEWCNKEKIKKIYLHLFTDGRDSPPYSAKDFFAALEQKIKELEIDAKLSSVSGRYFAMDRDRHWDRTKKAYDAIVAKAKNKALNVNKVLEENYENGISDEFIEPTTIVDKNKNPIGTIENGDALLFFNIRSDRTRQLVLPFLKSDFKGFPIKKFKNIFITSLTEYDRELGIPVVFPEKEMKNTLPEILSKNHKHQLHIAETEKYAHVTYFFSGGKEKPFPGETRIIIPSPKVATFDKKPEMSAEEVTKKVLEEIEKDKYDFIVLNFANPDMVGHTGNFKATIKALELLDNLMKEIVDKVLEKNGAVFITSDHGNAEMMFNPEIGEKDTEHNTFPSPFILIEKNLKHKKPTKTYKELLFEPAGSLCDIAPTILDLMHIKKPEEMTGVSLLNSLR